MKVIGNHTYNDAFFRLYVYLCSQLWPLSMTMIPI